MKTIRKYVAAGCDLAALTAEEQDALKSEARQRAHMERRLAVRAFFAGLFRGLMSSGADGVPTQARRPGVG